MNLLLCCFYFLHLFIYFMTKGLTGIPQTCRFKLPRHQLEYVTGCYSVPPQTVAVLTLTADSCKQMLESRDSRRLWTPFTSSSGEKAPGTSFLLGYILQYGQYGRSCHTCTTCDECPSQDGTPFFLILPCVLLLGLVWRTGRVILPVLLSAFNPCIIPIVQAPQLFSQRLSDCSTNPYFAVLGRSVSSYLVVGCCPPTFLPVHTRHTHTCVKATV